MNDQTSTQQALIARLEDTRDQLLAGADKLQKAVIGIARRLEQGSSDLLQELVSTGETVEKQKEKARKAAARKKPEPGLLDSTLNRAASSLGLATAEDFQALNKKLDSLTRKIRKLEKAGA